MLSINDLVSPLNGIVVALLRSPFHAAASSGLLVLSWKGRRSGKPFSIPLGYQLEPGGLFVLISKPEEKQWWRNFRSPWPVALTVRGRRRRATGEVVPAGTPEFFAYCERTLERLPWMGTQIGGVQYDPSAGLSQEQRAVLAANAGVVRFRFDADAE